MSEEKSETMNDSAIPDASKFRRPGEQGAIRQVDALEKEEREAAKKGAKIADKGAYICTTNILGDGGKKFKKGDEYEGKLYSDLLEVKAIVTKEAWNNAARVI